MAWFIIFPCGKTDKDRMLVIFVLPNNVVSGCPNFILKCLSIVLVLYLMVVMEVFHILFRCYCSKHTNVHNNTFVATSDTTQEHNSHIG